MNPGIALGAQRLSPESTACRVWDIDTLDCVRVLEGHNEAVLALAVGPSFLVSGSYDTTVRFWALDSLRCVRWALTPNAVLFASEVPMCQCCSPINAVLTWLPARQCIVVMCSEL